MPRIVFVCNELGAFRRHREHLARAVMAAQGEAVLLAGPVGDAEGMGYEYRPLAIERFRFDPAVDFRLFSEVLRILRSERPDAIHLINIKPYLYGGLAAMVGRLMGWRGRVVATVPGLGRLHEDEANRVASPAWLRRLIVEGFLRFGLRGAQVTFETEHDRDVWLARGIVRPDQVTVTRGTGIDYDRFAGDRDRPDDRKLKVLYAGRLLRAKGLEVFLEAAGRVDQGTTEMLVAGFSEDDPDAIAPERLRAHPHITFLGEVGEMGQLLRSADIVVLPTRYNEGIPRILIEAAAAGCVPVATSFPGSRELISDGETGFFLKSGGIGDQVTELVELVDRLRDNPEGRRKIGEKASQFVRDSGFTAEQIAATFLGLYGFPKP